MNSAKQKKVLTGRQAARILGISGSQVTRLCQAGKIPAKKLGHYWMIEMADILREKRVRDRG